MEIDININDILREVITFLECLRDAQLPLTLESLREKLLVRSKNTLTSVTTMSSPEPYLDMKSGPRSLLLTRRPIADSEEYVGMEESQKGGAAPQTHSASRAHTHHQDYYETFENESQAASAPVANEYPEQNDEGQMLIGIYKNLSAMQIRSKCYKCGPLYRKEGKKLFLSESRACWIALVGSHLLVYRSERHNRPYAIYPIRGYMARPAPNMIPRDRRKSESAFEMYSPGNETLQFIARTPKDMDQWIAKICEVGCSRNESEGSRAEGREKKRRVTVPESLPLTDCRKGDETDEADEAARHRDAGKSVVDKSMAKVESTSNNKNEVGRKDTGERVPPLPARIPRRLPSLPPANPLAIPSYRATVEGDDDDDDDDIYHRIEDLRNETRYQNMVVSKKQQADDSDERQEEAVTYDDVRAPDERNERNEKVEGQMEEEDNSRDAISFQETYDDIVTLSRINATSSEAERSRNNDAFTVDGEKGEEFYDDVESLIPNRRLAKNQIEMSSKLQKKSFLDRVLSRRESPGKSDKRHRYKDKVSSNPSSLLDTEEIPTYDDASDLTPTRDVSANGGIGEDVPEYTCPPPPRPIYQVKSPAGSTSPEQTEDVYDDVSAYKNHHQQIIPHAPGLDICASVNEAVHNTTRNTESETNGDSTREEMEHYQLPRSDLRVRDAVEMEQNEQLYDDIALWADFTARQRDIAKKRESEDAKSVSVGSDKKAWNRFAVNRKSRVTSDFNCSAEANKRGGNEGLDEMEDSLESSGSVKRNTFQKLISRMENSLAKVSARSPSSFSTAKPSTSSNSS
ncbi:uncharacterized protein [Temnothorax longispinosus]|uniref:uncharacterized protein n=1 Tax=Temnothorax longispinosus TaxID=300112 RepID=UPI003A998C6C